MSNPLRQLKFLPWLPLFQVAALTVFFAAVLELLLAIGFAQSSSIQTALSILLAPPLDLLIVLAVAVGIGALAVYLLERLYRQLMINTPILWALVLCLMVMLALKSVLPLPALLVGADQTTLIGVVLGLFWQGRSYWR